VLLEAYGPFVGRQVGQRLALLPGRLPALPCARFCRQRRGRGPVDNMILTNEGCAYQP
jgi:hypothetical protein